MSNENQLDEQTQNKVLNRVRKMMNLANDAAATEGERDNALRMAHATLAKYNLSMSQAEATGAKPEEAREGAYTAPKNMHPWERTVAHAIARLFFCNYFYVKSSGGHSHYKHCFIGRTSNTFTAQQMTEFVCSSINKEAMRVAKEQSGKSGGEYWRSFCKGAAAKIHERCREIRANAEKQERTPGTSLVLASVYKSETIANDHHLVAVMNIRLRSAKSTTRRPDYSAYSKGQTYGAGVSLNVQVKSDAGNKQLK